MRSTYCYCGDSRKDIEEDARRLAHTLQRVCMLAVMVNFPEQHLLLEATVVCGLCQYLNERREEDIAREKGGTQHDRPCMLKVKLPLADRLSSDHMAAHMFLNGLCDAQFQIVGLKTVEVGHGNRLCGDFKQKREAGTRGTGLRVRVRVC